MFSEQADAHDADETVDRPASAEGETLEDAARDEREYVKERVREELGREPTEAEVDEWLSEHTEGY